MPNGYREVEELEMTRVEKMFVLGLIVFLLIGGFWMLGQIETLVPEPIVSKNDYRSSNAIVQKVPIEDELGIPPLRSEVERLQKDADQRQSVMSSRERTFQEADSAYRFRREEYRTAMEAGRVAPTQVAAYQQTRKLRDSKEAEYRQARKAYDTAAARLKGPQKRLSDLQNRAWKVFNQRSQTRNLILFALHFLYAGAVFFLSWKAWQWGRREQWRFLSLLTALLTASVIQLVFLAFRYCWELVLKDFALLGIALVGIIGCSLALVALKRYVLSPERIARNRLAAHSCPNCSTPFRDGQTYCWDCGRPLLDPCPHCGQPHLRYAPHCDHCGNEVPAPVPA
jgi:hypothetical protein